MKTVSKGVQGFHMRQGLHTLSLPYLLSLQEEGTHALETQIETFPWSFDRITKYKTQAIPVTSIMALAVSNPYLQRISEKLLSPNVACVSGMQHQTLTS